MFSLASPINELYGVSDVYTKKLAKLGIKTVGDLLTHYPSRYEDYRLRSDMDKLQMGEKVTVNGKVKKFFSIRTRLRKTIIVVTIEDGETNTVDLVFFNQPYLEKIFKEESSFSISGTVGEWQGKKTFIGPDYEESREGKELLHTGRLVPIYPETAGVSSKWLRSKIAFILQHCSFLLNDELNNKIVRTNNLLGYGDALRQIHFPDNEMMLKTAQYRLSFEELFYLQLASLKRKEKQESTLTNNKFKIQEYKEDIKKFMDNLPFKLTFDQRKTVGEILTDLAKETPMNRLLQGEVGSGKTVVAAIAMYMAYLNGYQSILMAPTQILANQHYLTVKSMLERFGLKINLVTQITNSPPSPRLRGASKIQKNIDIFIGTHALLNEKIDYKNVGLVVIDEQQRFGVEQRAQLIKKGINPHVMTMTATPIPRTVALTVYGDIDMSVIKTMPVGRIPVKTWVVPNEKRQNAYQWIKSQISNFQSQLFIVCPLIEESETLTTVKSAKKEYGHIQAVFEEFKVGLLHGRMKTQEKDKVLQEFKNKQLDILVATPVVEVGIDIPGATIMVIEGAERFGLAQLHQLRGRVGRNDLQGYCLLFTEAQKTTERLKAMETLHNGLELAERDLQLRGPGEIYGKKQHGIPELKIASFADADLIEKTKKAAEGSLNSPLPKNYFRNIIAPV